MFKGEAMKPADSDQIAKAREQLNEKAKAYWVIWLKDHPTYWQNLDMNSFWLAFAESERQAVIEECAKIAEGEILLPLEALDGTKRKYGTYLASEIAKLIRSME